MRRLTVLLLALVACALVAAPAQAARVKEKAVTQDKAAVERYWTAERMAQAKPADLLVSGTGALQRATQTAALAPATQIPPPYTSQPTSTNGKVFFTDGGVSSVCSG